MSTQRKVKIGSVHKIRYAHSRPIRERVLYLYKFYMCFLEMFLELKFLSWWVNFWGDITLNVSLVIFLFLEWIFFLSAYWRVPEQDGKYSSYVFLPMVWKMCFTSAHFLSRIGKVLLAETSPMRKLSIPEKKMFALNY